MSTFKITALMASTTKTGKAVKNTTLLGEDGASYEKVSIWSDFQDFANLAVGSTVVGDIVTNDKGYKSLYPPKTSQGGGKSAATGAFRTQQAKELIAEKDARVKVNMDDKQFSIKVSGTMRDAVLLTIAEKGDRVMTAYDMKKEVLKWRKWLWAFYDHHEKYPPFFSSEKELEVTPDELESY